MSIDVRNTLTEKSFSLEKISFQTDKPPVYRECYASIRHVKEKDIVKSDDCVLLRPENAEQNGLTPYLAKVKWFWAEPESGMRVHLSQSKTELMLLSSRRNSNVPGLVLSS